MYSFAVNHRLAFYQKPEDVTAAAERGRLVQLAGGPGWDLSSGVGWAYATPEAVAFLDRLGPEYERECQSPMVVTSATRPKSRTPRNGHQNSVHPTGIAVDLRKPYRGPCLDWLRKRLLELEAEGKVEAIEERRPPHFHIAVLSRPGSAPRRALQAYAASEASVGRQLGTSGNLPWGAALRNASPGLSGRLFAASLSPAFRNLPVLAGAMAIAEPPARAASMLARKGSRVTVTSSSGSIAPSRERTDDTYVVRPGDTLWEIAKKHGVTVEALRAANALGKKGLQPKMELKIPASAKSAN